ncbi:hypothetical protein CJF42_14170 [Pseudoalteromonas sp. NBT06-2]|uniref:hypothetical protein n=1 Tax=Pseudoalteromonas sp. NBT06-2 TaxID=2025950 RepID=UPI000BA6D3B0|nr:hypothetical protein [Pseudoalteromonas sp. NBT06-2]PAJ73711.1 hypothetical protein CJF42_14170 [Pseudoalteromonas sp. NBT06-2]
MFSLDKWLILLILLAIVLQGYQLKDTFNAWIIGLIIVFPPLLCTILSEYLVMQSVTVLQQKIYSELELVCVIVLLETLLTCFLNKNYKLPLLSVIGAIIYGQMLFYQMGWFSLSFTVQGFVFGLVVSGVVLLTTTVSLKYEFLDKVLILSAVAIIWLQTSKWPLTRQLEITPDYRALVYCSITVLVLLCVGYSLTYLYNLYNQRKRV